MMKTGIASRQQNPNILLARVHVESGPVGVHLFAVLRALEMLQAASTTYREWCKSCASRARAHQRASAVEQSRPKPL